MITLRMVKDYFKNLQNQNYELIWAKTWDDTKRGIEWMEHLPGISPGRWAVGYNYLYVMTRILNEKEPHEVLDLGLGISSTLISHYFEYKNFEDGCHTIVEHDKQWAEFYAIRHTLFSQSKINVLKCVEKEHNHSKYNAYDDLGKVVNGRKYDVISIDAPKGSEKYSRRDVLEFLPNILNPSFVIVIDDAQRHGERMTIAEIEEILTKNNIEFCQGVYPGMTDLCVITSTDNKFLCTM